MKTFLRHNGVWIGLFALGLVLTIWTQGDFLSARNLTNLIRQTALNGILAAGMTMIILTGGIDLSIGSTVALCGVLVGLAQVTWGYGIFSTICLALAAGGLMGALNGVLISALRLAPFVITLGMMVIARGLSMILSGGSSISPMSEDLNTLASGYFGETVSAVLVTVGLLGFLKQVWGDRNQAFNYIFSAIALGLFGYSFFAYRGFPYLGIFLLLIVALTWLLLNRTVLGRGIYAIGSNEKAAYWAGVSIRKVKIAAYTLMGLYGGLTAFLLTGRLNGADPNAGQLFELDAIAAVVIGGVSLKGGSGTVTGSLIGALMMATLNNGMDLLGVSSFYQMVLKGLIIILAVAMDRNQRES
jgi:D-xylose transport system permease protein